MNSLIIKRGLKNVETFKSLSKRLARTDEIVPKPQKKEKKPIKNISSSIKLVPNKKSYEIKIQEPITFAQQCETSPILSKILEEEKNNEIQADAFLGYAVEQSDKNEDIDWSQAMNYVKAAEQQFPIAQKDLTEIMSKPGVKPTYNFASIVNHSPTLQRLVDLGTKISKWEENDYMDMALGLDFDNDIAPRIHFLVDHGIPPHHLGHIFTENPELFNQDMDDLHVRINYLVHKKFSKDQISQILHLSDSKWLNFKAVEIDARLGFILQLFALDNGPVRYVASKCPELILWNGTPTQLENNHLALSKFMEFDSYEMKTILTKCPKIFMQQDTDYIQDRFDILYHDMGYDRELIVHFASSMNGDLLKMRARLKLLQKLNKAQVDPTKPNYVSPEAFALYDDVKFCENVAKIPIDLYNKFMQTV